MPRTKQSTSTGLRGKFVSPREREILAAVARLATSNPFARERIEDEREALGEDFVLYSEVWHMDGQLEAMNPNIHRLSRVAEELAEDHGSSVAIADLRGAVWRAILPMTSSAIGVHSP